MLSRKSLARPPGRAQLPRPEDSGLSIHSKGCVLTEKAQRHGRRILQIRNKRRRKKSRNPDLERKRSRVTTEEAEADRAVHTEAHHCPAASVWVTR